jgi:hypothetical protein
VQYRQPSGFNQANVNFPVREALALDLRRFYLLVIPMLCVDGSG